MKELTGKTKIVIEYDDQQHHEYKKGEVGYVDGYIRGGDNRPYAVVIIDDRLTLIPFYSLKVVKP